MTRHATAHLSGPEISDATEAIITVVSRPPATVAGVVHSFRRGGCRAQMDIACPIDSDGVLSIAVDDTFISRPIRIGGVADDGARAVLFAPIPDPDPRWVRFIPESD